MRFLDSRFRGNDPKFCHARVGGRPAVHPPMMKFPFTPFDKGGMGGFSEQTL